MTELNYLLVSCTLFLLGIWGIFLNRKNIIIMLMSIELMLLAVNFNFLIFSVYLDDLMGQIFSLFILTVAAAESSIGLALLVIYYRKQQTIAVEFINLLKLLLLLTKSIKSFEAITSPLFKIREESLIPESTK